MRIKPVFLLCLWLFLVMSTSAQHGPYHNDKIDSYGNLAFKHEKERLDWLAKVFREEPDGVAYIYVYTGRVSCIGEAKARALRARNYLVEKLGIPGERIVWKDAGYREELTFDLWVRPRGAPEPYAVSTVEPNEVRVAGRCNGKFAGGRKHAKQ